MKRLLSLLLGLCALPAVAAAPFAVYTGTGTTDGSTVIETGDLSEFNACNVMSTTGTVSVYVSYDGTVFALHHLEAKGTTSLDPVLVTEEDKPYALVGFPMKIRILQVGATAATAVLRCGRLG